MPGLRGRSAVAADHRSALPHLPGIPWWAAALVAIALTAIGVAYDAGTGGDALSGVFAACYVLGCVGAVLAVRQSGVFTAVIQPPLILFVAVPFAYFVFHGSKNTTMKDTLINCGYPLIERFPLMFFTTAAVLLIGMVRWFLGAAAKRAVATDAEAAPEPVDAPADVPAPAAPAKPRRSSTRAARAASAPAAAAASDALEDVESRPPRKSSRTTATGAQRSSAATAGTGSRRSRHARESEAEVDDSLANRPRRRTPPPADSPAEPRRRPRAGETREPREREPRDPRTRESRSREAREREPRERRPLPPLDRRTPPERSDRPQRRERPDAQEQADRPQRRPRAADYEPYEPPPSNRNGSGTHHPVSRVRYRGADDGESRVEQRARPRRSRHAKPDSWEYDV